MHGKVKSTATAPVYHRLNHQTHMFHCELKLCQLSTTKKDLHKKRLFKLLMWRHRLIKKGCLFFANFLYFFFIKLGNSPRMKESVSRLVILLTFWHSSSRSMNCRYS